VKSVSATSVQRPGSAANAAGAVNSRHANAISAVHAGFFLADDG
jgi:hypothetical protein